jgi:hypothetical protein
MGQKTRRNFRFCVGAAAAPVYQRATDDAVQQEEHEVSMSPEERQLQRQEKRRKELHERVQQSKKDALESAKRDAAELEQSKRCITCAFCKKQTQDRYGTSDELKWFRVGQCTGYCGKCSSPYKAPESIETCGCKTKYNPTGKLMFCSELSCYAQFRPAKA